MDHYKVPPESYSRMLDDQVAREEEPYGYTNSPPPADTGDFNQERLNCHKQYPMRRGRAV